MTKTAQFLVVVLLYCLVAASVSAQASYRDAERWFNALSFENRAGIQLALIWTGDYNGLVDGALGRRTYRSIQAYQQNIGAPPTGTLSRRQFDELMALASGVMDELGFDFVSDQTTGLTLALPTAIVFAAGPTRRGYHWASPDKSVEVETVAMPVTERSYLQLYERLSRERPNRRVTYRTFKPSFFVVSGYVGTTKFYSRFQPGPVATRGFSLAWDPSLGPIMDRLAVAMSSLLLYDNSDSEPFTAEPDKRDSPEPEQRAADEFFQGTGFFVSTAGHLVTNDHVVERCRDVVIRLADGQVSEARIVARSSDDDLAILEAEMAPDAVAGFRSGQPVRVGEGIVVFGFPLAGTFGMSSGVLTTGHVSALAGPGDHPGLLQMSAPVQSGNSGSPLLDQSGNVIGVVTWKSGILSVPEGLELLQNMNFAVKSSVVINMLDAHGVPYMTKPSDVEKAVTDIADEARQYTALVVCLRS
jgi:serine protease Do